MFHRVARVHPREELAQLLDAHIAVLRAATPAGPLLDLRLAEDVHRRMAAVLDRWNDLTDEDRVAVTETVTYVVTDDDEEHDLRSPIGLEDDAERVADLERRLGLRPPG